MRINFTKAFCLTLCILLLLAGCAGPGPGPGRERKNGLLKPLEKTYDDSLIDEIVWECELSCEDGEPPVPVSYRLPQLRADTEDARRLNAEWEKLRSDAEAAKAAGKEREDIYYKEITYKSYWNGSLLSLVVERSALYGPQLGYSVYNYDFEAGKALSNAELFSRLNTDGETVERALRFAAAGRFDEDCRQHPEAYGDCFDAFELRAQTVSTGNLQAETASLFLDGGGRLCACALIGVPAGSGTYTAKLCLELEPPRGVSRTAECDFISAELKDNAVTLRFADTDLAGPCLPGDGLKFDTPYPVEGLYGEYTDLALGFLGNGGSAYLLLIDKSGCITFCNIMTGMNCGPRFFAVGPLPAPSGVKSCVSEQEEDGYSLYAVTEDGRKLDLYEAISSAEAALPFLFRDRSWETQDGACRLSFSGDTSFPSWHGGSVSADGEPLSFLGMTESGLHFSACFYTDSGGSCCILTLGCPVTSEDAPVLTVTQGCGPQLPGLPKGGELALFQREGLAG